MAQIEDPTVTLAHRRSDRLGALAEGDGMEDLGPSLAALLEAIFLVTR